MARTKAFITGSTEDHREVLQGEQLLPHGFTSQRAAKGGAVKFRPTQLATHREHG